MEGGDDTVENGGNHRKSTNRNVMIFRARSVWKLISFKTETGPYHDNNIKDRDREFGVCCAYFFSGTNSASICHVFTLTIQLKTANTRPPTAAAFNPFARTDGPHLQTKAVCTCKLMLAASITSARDMHATPSKLHGVSDSAEERVSAFMKVAKPTTMKHTTRQSLIEYLRPYNRRSGGASARRGEAKTDKGKGGEFAAAQA